MSTLQKKSEFNLFSFFFQQSVFVTVWHAIVSTSLQHPFGLFGLPNALEVVWTLAGWIGVLVATIGTVQHIQTRTVPLVRSFKARILPRPLPFRYVLSAVMLTLLVLEVTMVKGMQTTMQTGAVVTEIVQQTGNNGFLNDLTAGILPTASVAYTLWCNSFKTPTSKSSNGSFAFLPKNQFNSFMTKAINSHLRSLDFKSGYASFDITNWGEGDIVEWNSYGVRHKYKFSTFHRPLVQTCPWASNKTTPRSRNSMMLVIVVALYLSGRE